MKLKYRYSALFVLLALGMSYILRSQYFARFYEQMAHGTLLIHSGYLLACISTLTAGLIIMFSYKGLPKRITITGPVPYKNLLIAFLPVVAFGISGLNNIHDINKSLYGIGYTLINLIYAFGEEFGWRRVLQNLLEDMNKSLKYLTIGIVWWIWHFRFSTPFDFYFFPLICIGGGFLLGKLADDQRSVLPVTAIHTMVIVTTNSGTFAINEMVGIGLMISVWIIIEFIDRQVSRPGAKPSSG